MAEPSKTPRTFEENNQQSISVIPKDSQSTEEQTTQEETVPKERFILKPTDRFYFSLGR